MWLVLIALVLNIYQQYFFDLKVLKINGVKS